MTFPRAHRLGLLALQEAGKRSQTDWQNYFPFIFARQEAEEKLKSGELKTSDASELKKVKMSETYISNSKAKLPYPSAIAIWAFGGGKGGVGKSFVCSNLSVCLAQLGHNVTVIDLDIGGANLHTCFGGVHPKATLSDFISQRIPHLEILYSIL